MSVIAVGIENQVVVLHAVVRLRRAQVGWRQQSAGELSDGQLNVRAGLGHEEGGAHSVAQTVGVPEVESPPGRWRLHGQLPLVAPVLGDEQPVRVPLVQRLRQLLAERPPAEHVDDRDLVEPQSVSVVLRQQQLRVADEELADLRLPKSKTRPPAQSWSEK